MRIYTTRFLSLALLLFLFACVRHHDAFTIRENQYRGHYKIGKRYKIKNISYAPKEIKAYDKVGIASWYGPGFYHNATANGEIFTGHDLTAAHATLPLPCIVRVTNLKNNRSVLVRVNDRGPFHGKRKRIIDLSEYAAELLEIKRPGIGLVRVKLLPSATKVLHEKLDIRSTRK